MLMFGVFCDSFITTFKWEACFFTPFKYRMRFNLDIWWDGFLKTTPWKCWQSLLSSEELRVNSLSQIQKMQEIITDMTSVLKLAQCRRELWYRYRENMQIPHKDPPAEDLTQILFAVRRPTKHI